MAGWLSDSGSTQSIIIEVGPHGALKGPLRQSITQTEKGPFKYIYLPTLVRNKSAVSTMLALTGRAFELGYPVQLQSVLAMKEATSKFKAINNLPSYPWDHTSKYWHKSRISRSHRLCQFIHHDVMGLLDVVSSSEKPRWRYHISLDALPWTVIMLWTASSSFRELAPSQWCSRLRSSCTRFASLPLQSNVSPFEMLFSSNQL